MLDYQFTIRPVAWVGHSYITSRITPGLRLEFEITPSFMLRLMLKPWGALCPSPHEPVAYTLGYGHCWLFANRILPMTSDHT